MVTFTYVEVDPSDNTPMSAGMVYKNVTQPVPVAAVRLYDDNPEGELYAITGWSSAGAGTPCEAYAVQVEDSGSGQAYLVYGGDWGVRLRPQVSTEPWSLSDPAQRGETHLLLSEEEDIIPA